MAHRADVSGRFWGGIPFLFAAEPLSNVGQTSGYCCPANGGSDGRGLRFADGFDSDSGLSRLIRPRLSRMPRAAACDAAEASGDYHPQTRVSLVKRGSMADQPESTWTFLTNHAAVLLCIAHDPGIRTRDIAAKVDITERAVQRIVADLEAEEYIGRTRVGRRNVYKIRSDRRLRHPVADDQLVGELLDLLRSEPD